MTDTMTLPADCGEFAELQTREEVFGFLIACCRSEGLDEVAECEIAARAAGMSRDERRRTASTLKRLGYHQVSLMLRHLKPLR